MKVLTSLRNLKMWSYFEYFLDTTSHSSSIVLRVLFIKYSTSFNRNKSIHHQKNGTKGNNNMTEIRYFNFFIE